MGNENNYISIRGARVHNLKNVDIDIPRDKLVVITGVSGSGKSSLAFDTIFAEGQRRYIESLSTYARQFLTQLEKPDVDLIEGLPPTVAIEQRTIATNPRSTVATTSEIYDYLRLLYARVGTPHCHKCGQEVSRQGVDEIIDRVMRIPPDTRIMLLAPVIKGKKGEHREVLEAIRKEGFVRARVDGVLLDITQPIKLSRYRVHHIDVLVDRLVMKEEMGGRLYISVQTCLEVGEGMMILSLEKRRDQWDDTLFSQRYACKKCGVGLEELEPRLFSFNSPYGACPECEGLGSRMEFDPDLIAPDKDLSLRQGTIIAWEDWGTRANRRHAGLLKDFSKKFPEQLDVPFKKLPRAVRDTLIHGSNGTKTKDFDGVIPALKKLYDQTKRKSVRRRLESYMSKRSCGACKGARLRPETLAVRVGKTTISGVVSMHLEKALKFFSALSFTGEKELVAREILKEVINRLQFMTDLGLGYLTLDRTSTTLSGGEAQRVRLASQVGSGLMGVCYVLDEPTIGLHARDGERLIKTLNSLRDMGNTVIVVEHDEETIRNADEIIDLGPGAGDRGGEIVSHGTLTNVLKQNSSVTTSYLRHERKIRLPARRRKINPKNVIAVKGARENNLKSTDVEFPLAVFCCVTGVSGSGKSTLVDQILHRALSRAIYDSNLKPGAHDSITGIGKVDKVIEIDQSPIGRTPRSNPATYTKVFSHVRQVFAQIKEAKLRGYGPGRFSFNVKTGRCQGCDGQGTKRLEMHFLPDSYVTCDQCNGSRYNRETLEIVYKDKTIADVLAMTVSEAHEFFRNIPNIERILRTLKDVGMGYITLGQSSNTLSGGEAQRAKLSTELSKYPTGRTFYILDEPTVGLHFADIENLLRILNRLVDMGNTVVVIEHHMDVIKQADYVIDLGPEGGDGGGELVAAGTPEQVAKNRRSRTGRVLKKYLA
ncbi:MAG: excinuclease ABC subunit UvrA [Planctomycetota bacterium]|jgi:excinuclease ABC subunit A